MNIRSILKVVVVAGLLSVTYTNYAAEEMWMRKTDMPTRRLGLSTSVANGKIYAIGGGYSIEGPHSRIVEEYDPVTDSWARKADMPTGRLGHAATVINGKIYVLGGDVRKEVSGAELEEYDPATDTWTRKANMPTKRTFLCSCAVDGEIYVIGGITAPAMHTPSALEVYDPSTDTWIRKADMPTTRSMATATVVDGKMYIIGGVIGEVGGAGISIVEEYDPATDTWTRKNNMAVNRYALSASAVDGKIYATGGATGYSDPFSVMEEYDTATDTWTRKTNMPITRYFHSTSAVGDKIFVFGGAVGFPPTTSTSMVEEYDTGLGFQSSDFNGDGIVDIKDLLRLIQSWGQDDPFVDIAPTFGDGIVDALDLELLMSSWDKPVDDPTLLAHWSLDEAEGAFAYDSTGVNDAVVVGGTTWLPSGGQVGGALQLDGIDGCAIADPILNPVDGLFSIFVWANGGAPGQVIVSQQVTSNWLALDAEGNLMTELKGPGRSTGPLFSETVITDGQWHRIGLVWDGSHRTLFVDGVAVAGDTQHGLEGSHLGLYIGAGKNYEKGTFFSGLIDEIRIYSRAVSP